MLNINRRLIRLLGQLVTAIRMIYSEISRNKNISRIILISILCISLSLLITYYGNINYHQI